jgi:hypothetical protein
VPRTLIAPLSFGLGDLVVSLPAIQALIAQKSSVWLIARAPTQRLLAERIEGLAGVVDEDAVTCQLGDRVVDLRDHPLQRDFWWGSAVFEEAFGRLTINDILGRICADFDIEIDLSKPVPLLARPRSGLDGAILLVHETDGADKELPAQHWARVAHSLRDDGYEVLQVRKGPEPAAPSLADIPVLVVPTPGDAVDVLSACRGVVGIDTGLTHIAVQQGVPTVAICQHASVHVRAWPHCRVLRAHPCTDECLAAEMRRAYNQQVSLRGFRPPTRKCPSGSACLTGIQPEAAGALLGELL